jgi:CheY-like chemotaxis protein
MNKILVMSNDPILKRKNVEAISASGFEVADVSDALDGLLMVDKNGFVAIVIDEELADIDGYRACQKIRQYSQIPIILLGTEQSDEIWAKIDDLGFDIYLKKPVSPRELVAQIKSILRRSQPESRSKQNPGIKAEITGNKAGVLTKETEEKKTEKPGELMPIRIVPVQETGILRFENVSESQLPTQLDKSHEVNTSSAISLQEFPSMKVDKGIDSKPLPATEKVATQVRPATINLISEERTTPPVDTKIIPKQIETTPSILTTLEETRSLKLDGQSKPVTQVGVQDFSYEAWTDARMAKLVEALANGKFSEIRPEMDSATKGGFAYPEVDRVIGGTSEETRQLLERLETEQVLTKTPYEKLHMDPDGGLQLVPVERCPHCNSGNLSRGQLIEHFACGNVSMEQDYKSDHKYICPKCGKELKLLGTDYRNIGIRYRCLDCNEIFPTPIIKWRSLTSSKVWSFEELKEIQLFSYGLNPGKRAWLLFQLKPKAELVKFLQSRGYQVEEMARIHGSSGAVHTMDILATRDDGLAKYYVGIGILIASRGKQEVGLEELFEFDTKAYDVGINYKVVIVIPKLNNEAAKFAERQKISVVEASDPSTLISFLDQSRLTPLKSKAQFIDRPSTGSGHSGRIVSFLRQLGYDAYEKVKVPGRSGAEHILDIFAQRDDVIVKPAIAIALVSAEQGQIVGIDKVSQFDAKAFDTGIRNKVLIGLVPISQESRQFAKQQRIKLLEEHELESLMRSWAMDLRS